ncbi:MAG: isoamylase early set domain-containing protein [Spirochaetia bacterium]
MLQKKPLGGKRFQVTFSMPPMPGVETLHLCGEFNGWSETANPMRRGPDGSWSATLSLEGGKSYTFRYRDDSGGWHNDWAADAYVPNQLGSENSVLDLAAQELTSGAVPAPEKKRRPQNSPAGRPKPMARGSQKRRRG